MRKDIVILIAEDDKGHFILTKQFLRHEGFENEIEWFVDGQETLAYLFDENGNVKIDKDKRYVLLLDIRMPKINGIEVLEKMKTHDVIKKIPVIMLTTSDDREQAQKCYDLGCNTHIVKPISNILIRAIKKVAERL
ncbi:MAG: response regulator [Planctomycetes bacterium]|nr:response regulator [Planctomycetota bacterium]